MDTPDDAAISHLIPSVQLTGSREEKLRKLDTLLHHLLHLRDVHAGGAASHASLVGTYGSTCGIWRPFAAGVVTGAVIAALLLVPSMAHATPSTTFWAPSTASCQARGVPHVTYDTYFWKGPPAGSQGAPGYPVDTGLTAGILPFNRLQAEAGFDLLLPSPEPLFLNAKLCTPESSLFAGSPGISLGFYNVGFRKDVTNYNVLHLMAQKGVGLRVVHLFRG